MEEIPNYEEFRSVAYKMVKSEDRPLFNYVDSILSSMFPNVYNSYILNMIYENLITIEIGVDTDDLILITDGGLADSRVLHSTI